MVQIKMPDLGSITNAVEAIQACRSRRGGSIRRRLVHRDRPERARERAAGGRRRCRPGAGQARHGRGRGADDHAQRDAAGVHAVITRVDDVSHSPIASRTTAAANARSCSCGSRPTDGTVGWGEANTRFHEASHGDRGTGRPGFRAATPRARPARRGRRCGGRCATTRSGLVSRGSRRLRSARSTRPCGISRASCWASPWPSCSAIRCKRCRAGGGRHHPRHGGSRLDAGGVRLVRARRGTGSSRAAAASSPDALIGQDRVRDTRYVSEIRRVIGDDVGW